MHERPIPSVTTSAIIPANDAVLALFSLKEFLLKDLENSIFNNANKLLIE